MYVQEKKDEFHDRRAVFSDENKQIPEFRKCVIEQLVPRMTIQMGDMAKNVQDVRAPDAQVKVECRPGVYRNRLKRVFDLAAVIISSPVVVLIVLILAALVLLQGNAPFYFSDRVGRGGRVFRMMKLRTMVHDADEILNELLLQDPEARREWSDKQKLTKDPRVTAVGRFLRKSSLDELPQLWNVLIGDMSLVGPRPMMPSQREIYPGTDYYGLRPGMTGFWQISDRNGCDFAKRAEFDTDYAQKLTFGTDLSVLIRTVGAVFRGTGY